MPLPNSFVIHPDWSQHHRPVAHGAQTSQCTITRTDGDGYLDDTGTWHPPDTVQIYSGDCRVTPASDNSRDVVIGENRIVVRRYQVTVEWDIPHVPIGALVSIDAANDPGLVDAALAVTDVQYASETFERVLTCEERTDQGESA